MKTVAGDIPIHRRNRAFLNTIVFASSAAFMAGSCNAFSYQPRLPDHQARSATPSASQSAGPAPSSSGSAHVSQSSDKAAKPRKKNPAPLVSAWPGGRCQLMNNTLTYFTGGKTASLVLDVGVPDATALVCQDHYSVIVGASQSVVALGAKHVMDGVKSLGGIIDGQIVWANSYHLNTSEPYSQVIRSVSIAIDCGVSHVFDENGRRVVEDVLIPHCLRIATGAGKRWTVDLQAPAFWYIESVY